MILNTERLTLRPVAESDADAVFRMMSNAEVMAYWDTAEINDPDVVDGIVAAQVAAQDEAGGQVYWSIERTADKAFLGQCDLSEIDLRHHRAEIGFLLNPLAWTEGYAEEAIRAVLTYAAGLALQRLSARTHVGNIRSESLLRDVGFEDEGVLRGYVDREGERRDCRLWGLLL